MLDAEFNQLLYVYFLYHLSKMALQATIVPRRLRSELCPWGSNCPDQ